MADTKQPSELARETLRQLALRRVPPTPDNYRTLYHEISGTPAVEDFPERALKGLASGLPRKTPEQMRLARQIDTAIGDGNWSGIKAALTELFNKTTATPPNWSGLIRDLFSQYESRHAGTTPAKKRESLEHVLTASGTPDILFNRLQSLAKNWSQGIAAEGALAEVDAPIPASAPASALAVEGKPMGSELQELLAQLLENTLSVLLIDTPDLNQEAAGLAADIRGAVTPEQIASFTSRLKKFSYRLQFVAEGQAELRGALLHLLQLIVENINELVVDDQWMQGQVSVVRDLVGQPLNLRQLDDVERRLKDLIYKQSALKKGLSETQDRLKTMLATFVDRLADFASTTGEYHERIDACADKISKAKDVSELSEVLDVVMQETRTVQLAAQRSHDELTEMRARVREAEQQVAHLQDELAQTSEMVRHDALTGALNRKGMDEAIEREVGRARRRSASMSVAMLDIDNFKKINDTYGHEAGDQALVHLAKVVRETLRPQDTLARYGGEEFVIILADTLLDDAINAMVRVQRELTRKFFLHNNEKLLITFSCGVAELGADEEPPDAVKRADQAMYLAKRAGKNRVVAA
ncbi:MAG: diguanylate cyclase [Gammaproteobacteria bacterium]|nr:diguanylate cyclase [Gammaproteobacteria bacterium]MBU1416530.1 diguanylate cyclase [Gammaproteobacteria bacterium]